MKRECAICGRYCGKYTLCYIHFEELKKETEIEAKIEFEKQIKLEDNRKSKEFIEALNKTWHLKNVHHEYPNETFEDTLKKIFFGELLKSKLDKLRNKTKQ